MEGTRVVVISAAAYAPRPSDLVEEVSGAVDAVLAHVDVALDGAARPAAPPRRHVQHPAARRHRRRRHALVERHAEQLVGVETAARLVERLRRPQEVVAEQLPLAPGGQTPN